MRTETEIRQMIQILDAGFSHDPALSWDISPDLASSPFKRIVQKEQARALRWVLEESSERTPEEIQKLREWAKSLLEVLRSVPPDLHRVHIRDDRITFFVESPCEMECGEFTGTITGFEGSHYRVAKDPGGDIFMVRWENGRYIAGAGKGTKVPSPQIEGTSEN
jgi:hypothetical protein